MSNNYTDEIEDLGKITQSQLDQIKRRSVYGLPDSPTASGKSADEIKRAMYNFVLDRNEALPSIINHLDNIVDYVNGLKDTLLANGEVDRGRITQAESDITGINDEIASVRTTLNTKANSSDVYAKSEVYNKNESDSAYANKTLLTETITRIDKILNGTTQVHSAVNATNSTNSNYAISYKDDNDITVDINQKFKDVIALIQATGGDVSGLEDILDGLRDELQTIQDNWDEFVGGEDADDVIDTLGEIRTALSNLQSQINQSLTYDYSHTQAEIEAMIANGTYQQGVLYFPTDDPMMTLLNNVSSRIGSIENVLDHDIDENSSTGINVTSQGILNIYRSIVTDAEENHGYNYSITLEDGRIRLKSDYYTDEYEYTEIKVEKDGIKIHKYYDYLDVDQQIELFTKFSQIDNSLATLNTNISNVRSDNFTSGSSISDFSMVADSMLVSTHKIFIATLHITDTNEYYVVGLINAYNNTFTVLNNGGYSSASNLTITPHTREGENYVTISNYPSTCEEISIDKAIILG